MTRLRLFLPLTSPLHNFNAVGVGYLLVTAAIGVVIGLVLRRRWRHRYTSYGVYAVLGLAAVTLLVHALCIWILTVDPRRDTGTVPLPVVARYAAEISFALLLFPGPLVCGALVPFVVGRDRGWLVAMLALVVMSYALWSTPWFGAVLFD